MSEIHIVLSGDPRPTWLIQAEDAISKAREDGWNVRHPIVFEGDPYISGGEPRVATWTIEPDDTDGREQP